MSDQSYQQRYLQLARAALAYDAAIQSCANDPAAMSSHCTAEGDTLDDLYAKWISLAGVATAEPVEQADNCGCSGEIHYSCGLGRQPVEQPRGEPAAWPEKMLRKADTSHVYGSGYSDALKDASAFLAAQPKPEQAVGDGVVGIAMETVGGDSVAVLNDDGKRLPNRSPLYASPRPAVATPVEVTDDHADLIGFLDGLRDRFAAREDECACDFLTRTIRALAAHPHTEYSAVPEGWKLVPIRITSAIHDAMQERCTEDMEDIWDAAIAAAPEVDRG